MISDNSKYYGAAFVMMIDACKDGLNIKRIYNDKAGFYLIDNKLPLLFKYSSKRVSPWSFSFDPDTIQRYQSLADTFEECLIVLVCGPDGIMALDYSEIKGLISFDTSNERKRIGIARRLKEMYYVTATDGNMKIKISQKSLLENLQRYLHKGV
jgi:hypothetical protein